MDRTVHSFNGGGGFRIFLFPNPFKTVFFSFAPSQFTIRVGEWDLSEDDNYSVELDVQTYEGIKTF